MKVNLESKNNIADVYKILDKVKEDAQADRVAAKKQENFNAAVYYQGKIAAVNEITEKLMVWE